MTGLSDDLDWVALALSGADLVEVIIKPEQMAEEIVNALEAKQGEDIKVFDVRGKSSVTDFYVVASGNSAPHLRALVSEASRHMKRVKVKSFRSSGEAESGWVVVDFIDVVVHLFSREARAYYAIEKLWDGSEDQLIVK